MSKTDIINDIMQNDARTCSFVISVMYERLLNADKYSPALLLCVIEAGDLLDSVKMPSGFPGGIFEHKRHKAGRRL